MLKRKGDIILFAFNSQTSLIQHKGSQIDFKVDVIKRGLKANDVYLSYAIIRSERGKLPPCPLKLHM